MSRYPASLVVLFVLAGCHSADEAVPAPRAQRLLVVEGDHQSAFVGYPLAKALQVQLIDSVSSRPIPGVQITWSTTSTGQGIAPLQSRTDSVGVAGAVVTLGSDRGTIEIRATAANGPTALFVATASPLNGHFTFSSITGTNVCPGVSHPNGAYLRAVDSLGNGMPGVVASITGGDADDVLPATVALAGPSTPVPFTLGNRIGAHVIHASAVGFQPDSITMNSQWPCPISITASLDPTSGYANVGSSAKVTALLRNDSGKVVGRAVTARMVSGGASISPATAITDGSGRVSFTLTASFPGDDTVEVAAGATTGDLVLHVVPGSLSVAATVVHPGGSDDSRETYVRDGIVFFAAYDKGIVIYDVGNGLSGGTPANPVPVSQVTPNSNGLPFGNATQRSRWFHNPVTSENRYLFTSQLGTANGALAGDIHVIDVGDLRHPVEVGFIHVDGGGPRGLWIDEPNQVLYAAYTTAGVIKVDVSGVLAGDLSGRIRAQAKPGGVGNTNGYDVAIAGNALLYVDYKSRLWALDPQTLATLGGGNGGPTFSMSGLATNGAVAYTGYDQCDAGIWRVWSLASNGPPTFSALRGTPNFPCQIGQLAVTPDHKLLGITTAGGGGFWLYDLADPLMPKLRAVYQANEGFCSVEFAVINGRTYAFLSANDVTQGIVIVDVTNSIP